MVGFSPSFHHPKMIDPFLVGTPQWLLGKPSSLGNPHDIALDFLDGWLGFMWDVFFLVAFLEAVFGSNFQGEKNDMVSFRKG